MNAAPRADDADAAERDLMLRARLGNREAFEHLVLAHHGQLRSWVARYLGEIDDINEVVQETLLGALHSLPSLDAQRPFGPWIQGVCRNQLFRFLRDRIGKRKRHQALVDEAMIASLEREDDAGDEALRVQALRQCVAGLSQPQQELLDWRYRDEVPVHDIAARLRTSEGGISMRLLRLKDVLMKCIRQRLGAT